MNNLPGASAPAGGQYDPNDPNVKWVRTVPLDRTSSMRLTETSR